MTENCQVWLHFRLQSSWLPFILLLRFWGINYLFGPREFFLQCLEWPPGGKLRVAILPLWYPVLIILYLFIILFFALSKLTRGGMDRRLLVRLVVSLLFVSCPATAALPGEGPEPEILVPGQSQLKLRARVWASGLNAAKKRSLAVSSGRLRHVSADDFVHCRRKDDIVLVSDDSPRWAETPRETRWHGGFSTTKVSKCFSLYTESKIKVYMQVFLLLNITLICVTIKILNIWNI